MNMALNNDDYCTSFAAVDLSLPSKRDGVTLERVPYNARVT